MYEYLQNIYQDRTDCCVPTRWPADLFSGTRVLAEGNHGKHTPNFPGSESAGNPKVKSAGFLAKVLPFGPWTLDIFAVPNLQRNS